jgi:hypothetical protein
MKTFIEIGEALEQAETLLVQLTRDHEKGECDCKFCMALSHLWAAIGQLDMAMEQSKICTCPINRIRNVFSQN